MKKYATSIRFLKAFNYLKVKDNEINRVDVLLSRILKEGPEDIEVRPEQQFHFSFHPESVTPKQIAHCLRSLAYKIGKLDG